MKRRTLLGALAAMPAVAHAQSPALPTVGVLVAGTPDPTQFLQDFRDALRNGGYIEGRNISVEIRTAGGTDPTRLRALAQELVALKAKLIVTFQTPPTEAAKGVTREIPIVMAGVGDPVGTGLVASLARPGGNITGVSAATTEVTAKNVDLLHELLPAAKRIGVLCNADDPFSKSFFASVKGAGETAGLETIPAFAHGASELDKVFAALLQAKVDAMVLQPSLGVQRAAQLVLEHRIAAACPFPAFARAGGLLSYTADRKAIAQISAVFADKILKGAKPADLPVEQPTNFELIINLKTAQTLDLTIPPTLLARADDVIE